MVGNGEQKSYICVLGEVHQIIRDTLYCKVCTCAARTAEPCFTFVLGLIKNGEIVETAVIVGLVLN
jgi:hypothetical protein